MWTKQMFFNFTRILQNYYNHHHLPSFFHILDEFLQEKLTLEQTYKQINSQNLTRQKILFHFYYYMICSRRHHQQRRGRKKDDILEKVSFSPVCESNLKDCTFSSHFQYLLFKEKNSFREHRQAEAGGDEKSNVCEEMGKM
jgi:hypothetical protein